MLGAVGAFCAPLLVIRKAYGVNIHADASRSSTINPDTGFCINLCRIVKTICSLQVIEISERSHNRAKSDL